MTTTKKILIGIATISSVALPITAISCTNSKAQLEKEIQIAKIQLANVEFADNFEQQFKEGIIIAEQVLKDVNSTDDKIKNTYNEFINNSKKVLELNRLKLQEYAENQLSYFAEINKAKLYAHKVLFEEKYKDLKVELVNSYTELETKYESTKTSIYTSEKTAELKKELSKIMDDIKAKKQALDNNSSADNDHNQDNSRKPDNSSTENEEDSKPTPSPENNETEGSNPSATTPEN